jgi:myo-inositol-1(or 4)-monophosphatase
MTIEVALADIATLERVARDAAVVGSEVAMQWWRNADRLVVETKAGPDDLVSQADRQVEGAIRARLRSLRPDDQVRGEESGDTPGNSNVLWLLDPIDGTTSFLYGRSDWSVSVAAVSRADGTILAGAVAEPALDRVTTAGLGSGTWMSGTPDTAARLRPVAQLARALVEINLGRPEQRPLSGPMLTSLVRSVRDVRRSGSAAAALAALATGRADAAWLPGLQPWDGAAGCLLATQAGAKVGSLTGDSDGRWPDGGDVLAASPRIWGLLQQELADVYSQHRSGGVFAVDMCVP